MDIKVDSYFKSILSIKHLFKVSFESDTEVVSTQQLSQEPSQQLSQEPSQEQNQQLGQQSSLQASKQPSQQQSQQPGQQPSQQPTQPGLFASTDVRMRQSGLSSVSSQVSKVRQAIQDKSKSIKVIKY